jgi:predicted nucleic acid-binding protein
MLLLDTSVVSELMRPRPNPRVLDWVAAQPLAEMAVATITVMEVRFGIALLPRSKRRSDLDMKFRQLLAQGFAGRVLPFDEAAADACADIRAARRRMGNPITTEDGMIAAIARVHGAPVATRDVGGFERCDLALINPWEA